jgi:predicted alpha/beta hydrolase
LDEAPSRTIEERIIFPALDGYQLVGTLYQSKDSAPPSRVIVFNTGGGIAAVKYRRFARFMADAGVPVLTYDYRGIGESRPSRLPGFSAVLEDWTEHDCGGAIAWLRFRYPDAEMAGVAHSVGTLLFGGAPNVSELTHFVMICPHTGYVGDYRAGYRLPMALLWHGVMPALTRLFGYFPGRLLRLGDDIPSGIALQWAARKTPHLRPEATDPSGIRGQLVIARCMALCGRALLLSVRDDAFATEAGARRFLSNFPNLCAERWVVSPEDAGIRRLGHFGVFRAGARSYVWPRLLAYVVHGDLPLAVTVAQAPHKDQTTLRSVAVARSADNSDKEIADEAIRGSPH